MVALMLALASLDIAVKSWLAIQMSSSLSIMVVLGYAAVTTGVLTLGAAVYKLRYAKN
jgi:hypothetical protein